MLFIHFLLLMSKFLCTSQSKCNSPPTCLSFRKSSESSRRSRKRDADSEANRKAAAWAWHERGGGEVIPTRPAAFETSTAAPRHSVVIPTRPAGLETSAAGSRHTRLGRPTSSLNVERTRDTGARELSSRARNEPRTTLFDASELSSLAEQISGYAKRLEEESAPEHSRAPIGHSNKLNWRAVDHIPSTTDFPSSEKAFTRHHRSSSDPAVLRPFANETHGALGTDRNVDHRESSKVEPDLSRNHFTNGRISKKLILRKTFFLIQKLCGKIPISNPAENPYWDPSPRVQNHHHFHHHYHFYHYPPDPDEERRALQEAKARRYPETFPPNTDRRFTDYPETQRNAADAAAAYWASVGDRIAASQGGKGQIHDYDRRFSPYENPQSTAKISKDRASRRRSEAFERPDDTSYGSEELETARIRRHSAEIGPSDQSWAGHL